MSTSNKRDTQFAGFAKLLMEEMLSQTQWEGMDFNNDDTEDVERYSKIIAQRAYDLVCHVAIHIVLVARADMSKISDMTAWPKDEDEV